MSSSEVARFRAEQALTEEAARLGLFGLAYGAAHHAFINQKTENIQRSIEQYVQTMPLEEAWQQIDEQIEHLQRFNRKLRQGTGDSIVACREVIINDACF